MNITVNLKDSYGRTLAYPASQDAQTLTCMLNRTTLTKRDLTFCLRLGATVTLQSHGVTIATMKPGDGINLPALERLS